MSLLLCGAASFVWRAVHQPREWTAGAVPVAFWHWRNETPHSETVAHAARQARAQTLFLRAGQFDYDANGLRRIRAASGRVPDALPLHLTYNATRMLLAAFERLDESALASLIVETFRADVRRAASDGARVVGVQLDIDVPTRLLPRYTRLLRAVRGQLPPGVQLSITGLPTWMDSPALTETLAAVDFWIPQCYGARVPERIDEAIPISSPELVTAQVVRARRLGRPFYAGLAAYGFAILYDQHGALVELRGDLDPARLARAPGFELIERRPFHTTQSDGGTTRAGAAEAVSSEWRYVYRAREDVLTDDLKARAGDQLLLDVPSAETLRASARAARAEGGDKLLGLCIFRLPGGEGDGHDPTTLTLRQIAVALSDRDAEVSVDVSLDADSHAQEVIETASFSSAMGERNDLRRLRVSAANSGTAGALLGDDAFTLTIRVPAGSVRGITMLRDFADAELLCAGSVDRDAGASVAEGSLRSCSPRRANAVRLRARAWPPGATAQAILIIAGSLPSQLPASVQMRADDGRAWSEEQWRIIKQKGGAR